MIEIEKKFILTEKQKKNLIQGAEFLGEKIFTDIYYDTAEYALTKNDIWLRSRNGNFELKIPIHDSGKNFVNQYSEVIGEEKIRQVFGIIPEKSFLEDIQSFGYESFCECKTARKKYKKGKFGIDLDEADFGGWKYSICEIELMIENKKNSQKASDEIIDFAKSAGLKNKNVHSKIIEYLFREKPKHYKALVKAGVVTE